MQEPILIHIPKGEQTDPSKGIYEQNGLTDNTQKNKRTTDIEEYFANDGEKEFGWCTLESLPRKWSRNILMSSLA